MMIGRFFSTTKNPYLRADGTRKHDTAKSHHPNGTRDFVAIDGEGMSTPDGHKYVLLGLGDDQIENADGLDWLDIIPWIYGHYEQGNAYVGFYLGYDFTQWLKSLPESRARALLTIDGKEARRSRSSAMHGRFLPVDVSEWQFDILGSKRLAFRYKPCDCPVVKCSHKKGPWFYVCDAGGFFQTSLLNVINPANWQTPIVTDEEYQTILTGKDKRASAVLDDDMRRYNRLENDILQRVMRDLNTGYAKLDVHLAPSKWFGPGQAAQAWMQGRAPTRIEITDAVPEYFIDAARKSYFGGWFEIAAHGIIPGESHEYDINSAYPYIISQLPCLLHGEYTTGTGVPEVNDGEICLVRAVVSTRRIGADRARGNSFGAMLHRDKQGRISRPLVTAGWYWFAELDAARRAKCIRHVEISEWVKYTPCACLPPLRRVENLYLMRLEVGKDTSLGKACKNVYNSMYGKTAQSVGSPVFANPVYASLITSGCRSMILDAIASHPGGKSNAVMVATDAVFFIDPHTLLPNSERLGGWEHKTRTNLTLFKPGVYWDDATRAVIAEGGHPTFKSRGISARDFAGSIAYVDSIFREWGGNPPSITDNAFTPEELQSMGMPAWPKVSFTSSFSLTTCLQALIRNEWHTAGNVDSCKPLIQSANPEDKRCDIWVDATNQDRVIYRSEPLYAGVNARYRHVGNYTEWHNITEEDYASVPYEKRFGMEDPFSDEVTQANGITPDEHQIGRGMFRLLTGQEN